MTQYFDLYGSTKLSMVELREAIGSALGIEFNLHDSSYRGGEYFRAELRDSEELVIQLNTFQLDNEIEVAEPDYSHYPVIFWVAWTDRGDELGNKLSRVSELDFLRRIER